VPQTIVLRLVSNSWHRSPETR